MRIQIACLSKISNLNQLDFKNTPKQTYKDNIVLYNPNNKIIFSEILLVKCESDKMQTY